MSVLPSQFVQPSSFSHCVHMSVLCLHLHSCLANRFIGIIFLDSILWVHAQLCLILCNPMDCSPPGSSSHGIFPARMLEWFAISFSRGFSWPRNRAQVFCVYHPSPIFLVDFSHDKCLYSSPALGKLTNYNFLERWWWSKLESFFVALAGCHVLN